VKIMDAHKAGELASQWGSLIRSGDPGACFYGFPLDGRNRYDGRPADENHRANCLSYCGGLIRKVHCAILDGTAKDMDWTKTDLRRLRSLWRFFRYSPTRS
jgi:hypothetical protein